MPRVSSGPHLWLDEARDKWTIIDGKRQKRTGFTKGDARKAQQTLADYIGAKHVVSNGPEPPLADVLAVYLREHIPIIESSSIAKYRVGTLEEWWGDKELKDVSAANCRTYVAWRETVSKAKKGGGGATGARGDLEVLRAAINYWHKEHGPLNRVPVVMLPQKPEGRKQWMTRSHIAQLLWASRKAVHNIEPEPKRRPRLVRHLSRFIIVGYYTGSRSGVMFGTKYTMLDFEHEFMQRKPHGARKSKKRAPPHKMSRRLKTWLLRWQRIDGGVSDYVVHRHGDKITKLRRSWATARKRAKLPDDVTPHTLRHSRATLLKKNRTVSDADAAQFLGMTLQTFLDTYGHYDPEWQRDAAEAR